MADMGFLEADHQRAEFRQAEPLRHLAAQHAALGLSAHLALARDDEHEGQPVMMRALQEAEQRAMCPRLRHAVQVEPGIDLLSPARQMRPVAAARAIRESNSAAGASSTMAVSAQVTLIRLY